jgi:hypothetical protein
MKEKLSPFAAFSPLLSMASLDRPHERALPFTLNLFDERV